MITSKSPRTVMPTLKDPGMMFAFIKLLLMLGMTLVFMYLADQAASPIDTRLELVIILHLLAIACFVYGLLFLRDVFPIPQVHWWRWGMVFGILYLVIFLLFVVFGFEVTGSPLLLSIFSLNLQKLILTVLLHRADLGFLPIVIWGVTQWFVIGALIGFVWKQH